MGSIYRLSSSIKYLKYSPALFLNLSTKVSTESAIPKRPPHAYNLYVAEHQRKGRENSGPGLLKKVANNWKVLDAETKQEYVDKAEGLRLKYQEEVSQFPEGKLKEMRDELKKTALEHKAKTRRKQLRKNIYQINHDLGRPTQPLTPYMLFRKERSTGWEKGQNFMQATISDAKEWRELDPETKQKYLIKYEANRKEYKERLKSWAENLIVDGIPDGTSPEVLRSLMKQINQFKELKEMPAYEVRKRQWFKRKEPKEKKQRVKKVAASEELSQDAAA